MTQSPSSHRPFLTARWLDLLLVSWRVPDALLEPYLPDGVELDRHDGSAHVSLVAFDFADVAVKGMSWPGLRQFPELNLRYYVRAHGQRGVSFIREYVPSRLIAFVARTLYNEPYQRVPYRRHGDAHELIAGGASHRIAWQRGDELYTPDATSHAHWIKEHELGIGRGRDGRSLVYRVAHSTWRIWRDAQAELAVDFGALYGEPWRVLAELAPCSTILAEGSPVQVFGAVPLSSLEARS
jgi:uncharacterized protein